MFTESILLGFINLQILPGAEFFGVVNRSEIDVEIAIPSIRSLWAEEEKEYCYNSEKNGTCC